MNDNINVDLFKAFEGISNGSTIDQIGLYILEARNFWRSLTHEQMLQSKFG